MKRAGIVAGVLIGALLLPMLFMGVLLGLSSGQSSPSEEAREEIPGELIGIYQAAAGTCEGLDWTVLAAIHKVETGFGTGPAVSPKGAQGPMQFLPSTFRHYKVDGDGDGRADIDNVTDAIFSAAKLLCANGAGDPAKLADAIWNYNHSEEYVNEVLALASGYGVPSLPPGVAYAGSVDLLSNPRVILMPAARSDLEAGTVDARLVSLLAWVAQSHTIEIGVFKSGHSKYTRSGRVSYHYYGRAADIGFVDGAAVSIANLAAKQVVLEIAAVSGDLRPTEIGHPFGAIGFPGGFTDADHAGHLHIGFR